MKGKHAMEISPSVIVIVSDTFRPDHLAINGHPWVKTPELDALWRKCAIFDNATVSSFPTIPTRTDWFTGRFSHPHYGWQDLDPEAITFPDILGAAGYTTQLLADTTHMLRAGFWRPFHHFHFLRGHEGDKPLARGNDPIGPVISDRRKTRVEFGNIGQRPTLSDIHAHTNFRQRYEDESHISLLADAACRWVEDNCHSGPFLLWLDCFDVHEPWRPPEYMWRMYDPDYEGQPMVHPNYHTADVYSTEELKNMGARYAAMCTLTSKHIGRVLRVIEDSGLLEDTIIVFLSDHGIYLGERGLAGKSLIHAEAVDCFPFHVELTRMCWSMYIPEMLGLRSFAPGTRYRQVIQAPDLLPTLLDLCGIPLPQELTIEGSSLVPLLRGDTSQGPRDISMTAWSLKTHHDPDVVYCRRPTVTDGVWTLLLNGPPDPKPPRLYHVMNDDTQQRDVLSEHREEAHRLHRQMIEWLESHGAKDHTLARLSSARVGLS
jgi:arylsulfatase A-like enzyme